MTKIFEGFLIGFSMGFVYFVALRIRTRYALGKKYLYYIGWIISLVVFAIVFLYINKYIAFNIISFLIGILISQILVVSFYYIKSQKQ